MVMKILTGSAYTDYITIDYAPENPPNYEKRGPRHAREDLQHEGGPGASL